MNANPARKIVAALLDGLDGWNIVDKARVPDRYTAPTALVWTSKINRVTTNGVDWIKSTVELWLIAPTDTSPDKLEDRLDSLLGDALLLIEPEPAISWDEATRGVFEAASAHGWHLVLTVIHTIQPD